MGHEYWRDLDLLSAQGVRLAGRLEALDDTRVRLRDDLIARPQPRMRTWAEPSPAYPPRSQLLRGTPEEPQLTHEFTKP